MVLHSEPRFDQWQLYKHIEASTEEGLSPKRLANQ